VRIAIKDKVQWQHITTDFVSVCSALKAIKESKAFASILDGLSRLSPALAGVRASRINPP
jgi:hypothetical protein